MDRYRAGDGWIQHHITFIPASDCLQLQTSHHWNNCSSMSISCSTAADPVPLELTVSRYCDGQQQLEAS